MRRFLSTAIAAVIATVGSAFAQTSTYPEAFTVLDDSREREILSWLYRPASEVPAPLAFVSPGAGASPRLYSFLSEALAAKGYLVAAITQEAPSDGPFPTDGNIFARRMPLWRQGLANIDAVEAALRRKGWVADGPLVLVGHSHGGDISMLFATERPERVAAAVSLDNRRMPLPRVRSPRICSIRSFDQAADPGVLPTPEEAAASGVVVAQIDGLSHNGMNDFATPEQKRAMLQIVEACVLGTAEQGPTAPSEPLVAPSN